MKKKGIIYTIHRFLWKIKVLFQEWVRVKKNKEILHKNIQYKDKFKGKRCFVIGNGPSLTITDLNKLHENNEICFAANKIYQLFEETCWRPTFYGTCDPNLYKNNKSLIDNLVLKKFMPLDMCDNVESGINLFSRVPFQLFRKNPPFTPDLTKRLSEGGTITFFLMQIAVYMGFSEIYLLGCDFNFSYGIGVNGKYFENANVVNHFKDDGKKLDTMPNLQYNYRAYQSAKKYAEKHGIIIKNATRGGKLEVYERVDFEKLF